MQLEGDERRIARPGERRGNHVLHRPRLRRDRGRVPDLREQGLEVVREPGDCGVRVHDRHEGIVYGNPRAFGNGSDLDRQAATVYIEDVSPARLVEDGVGAEVLAIEVASGHDLSFGHTDANEVLLEEVLEAEERAGLEVAATALEEREDVGRAGRVLLPVRRLVAIRLEQNARERVGRRDARVHGEPLF